MASITWTNVTDIVAPELTGVAVAAQTRILSYVNGLHDVTALDPTDGEDGDIVMMARLYLAAHIGTKVGTGAGGAGAVTSESLGGLSRSYMVAASSGSALETTGYGVEYKGILERSAVRGPWIA
jgi:hypothetical protein